MIETSFEYPKVIGVLNYGYDEMGDSGENEYLLYSIQFKIVLNIKTLDAYN